MQFDVVHQEMNEPGLGAGIDPGMALTPLPSSIGRGSIPRPSNCEPSTIPLDHSFRCQTINSRFIIFEKFSKFIYISISLSLAHTYTHTLINTHTHKIQTHTYSQTLSIFLSLNLSQSQFEPGNFYMSKASKKN